jgi:hypothetical protein
MRRYVFLQLQFVTRSNYRVQEVSTFEEVYQRTYILTKIGMTRSATAITKRSRNHFNFEFLLSPYAVTTPAVLSVIANTLASERGVGAKALPLLPQPLTRFRIPHF